MTLTTRQPSRLEAFTASELKTLLTALAYVNHSASGPLRVEIIAEFERRRSDPAPPTENT